MLVIETMFGKMKEEELSCIVDPYPSTRGGTCFSAVWFQVSYEGYEIYDRC